MGICAIVEFLGRLFSKDWSEVDDVGCFCGEAEENHEQYSLVVCSLHKFGGKSCQGIKLEDLLYSCLLRLSEQSRIDVATLFSIQLIISL